MTEVETIEKLNESIEKLNETILKLEKYINVHKVSYKKGYDAGWVAGMRKNNKEDK